MNTTAVVTRGFEGSQEINKRIIRHVMYFIEQPTTREEPYTVICYSFCKHRKSWI